MASSTRTRILFVTPPGYGHLFPLVPLMWAVRAAGHDVRIATCGVSVNAAQRAGLAVVNVAPHADIAAVLRRHRPGFTYPFPAARDAGASADDPAPFAELCDVMADGVVETAREWRPNLIVYAPEAAPALLAASQLDIPAVFFSVGLGHMPAVMEPRYSMAASMWTRHGVTRHVGPAAWIDLSPPRLRRDRSTAWPMRYVPYNGGYPVAVGAATTPRDRVAVTLGTVNPQLVGLDILRTIVDAARHADADFVIAYGSESPRELGALPPNVQVHSWIALDSLASTCTAAIHHGGFGTTLTMLAAGLPQVIVPHGADQFYNADALERCGAAIRTDAAAIGGAIVHLLRDAGLRRCAEALRADIAAMPPPAALVERLIEVSR
jgi:UDP:flavonoid glycosyltransferase YjiC (YdhE family)